MSSTLERYLDYIFASQENFEKVIFEIETDEDRLEILNIIAHQIVFDSPLKTKLNFTQLTSIHNLDLSDLALSIMRLIIADTIEWLTQYYPDQNKIQKEIYDDKLKIYFLHELAMDYYFEHQEIFLSHIAESYFLLLQEAGSFRHIPKIGHDAIAGTTKMRSLFSLDNGAQIIRRADQVWMRVDQASKAKKRKAYTLSIDLAKYKEQIEDLQIRIKAIDESATLTLDKLRKIPADHIREVFTEDKPELVFERRLLAMAPAGELAAFLETQCERAAINAKTGMAREEFKKIQKLFTKAKINNTPRELQMRRMEFEHKLPQKKERYLDLMDQYQNIQDESLENFDEQLKKIKHVMIENLKKFPVNR